MLNKHVNTLTLLFVILLGDYSPASAKQGIQLSIRSTNITVARPNITIGNVADIVGVSSREKQRISELDLEVAIGSKRVAISKSHIEVRMVLAGISRDGFSVSGPDQFNVQYVPNEDLQKRVETELVTELANQFGIGNSDVQIRLLDQATLKKVRDSIDTASLSLMAIFPTRLPLGEKTILVEFRDVEGNHLTLSVPLRVIVLKEVFVTSNPIAKGTVITAAHVQQVKRPLLESFIDVAGAECVGCTAVKDIPQHEIVSSRSLAKVNRSRDVGVRRNDLVDIVLIQGSLQVRLKNAKVLTSGAIGDTVRVLNTNSNKQLNAVVQDKSTVIVNN